MFLKKAKQEEMLIATVEGLSPGNAWRCPWLRANISALSAATTAKPAKEICLAHTALNPAFQEPAPLPPPPYL